MTLKNHIPRYMTTKEAARYVALSPRTLEKYRRTGEGPIFRRFGGRVIYALDDIEAWANRSIHMSISDDMRPPDA